MRLLGPQNRLTATTCGGAEGGADPFSCQSAFVLGAPGAPTFS